MRNPWLDISEADYIGHMSSPAVNQRPVLNELLREVLENHRPGTVLVVGCSTGNGFEHVDPAVTARVTALDVNPAFVRRVKERFSSSGFELDVRCADVASELLEADAFDLVHAALIFEYVDWPEILPRLVASLRSGGVLSVVLQRPSSAAPAVTPTAFTSLLALRSVFRFVNPDALAEQGQQLGMTVLTRRTVPLAAGKAFEVFAFAAALARRSRAGQSLAR
jgi:SAM-dependent methyltransferase